jgi:hypothetical protein
VIRAGGALWLSTRLGGGEGNGNPASASAAFINAALRKAIVQRAGSAIRHGTPGAGLVSEAEPEHVGGGVACDLNCVCHHEIERGNVRRHSAGNVKLDLGGSLEGACERRVLGAELQNFERPRLGRTTNCTALSAGPSSSGSRSTTPLGPRRSRSRAAVSPVPAVAGLTSILPHSRKTSLPSGCTSAVTWPARYNWWRPAPGDK